MSLIDDARAGMHAAHTAPPTPAPAPPLPTAPPYGLPVAPPVSDLRCRCCGSIPAMDVTFRSNRGFILARRTTTYRGPFCRDCGISTSRKASAINLIAGWWGYISVVVTPVYLVMNAVAQRKVAKLAAPQWPAQGYSPLPVGRPLFLRWQALGLLLPIAVIALIVAGATSSSPSTADDQNGFTAPQVGTCVQTTSETEFEYVDCGSPHSGRITSIVADPDSCPPDVLFTALAFNTTDEYYCVETD